MMRHSALVIFFLVALCEAVAQHDDYNFINLNSKNGLSSNSVHVILKDRFGYMWFATEDGLNKFDGVNFTVYRHNNNDSSSIGAGTVTAMKEDSLGNLWVGAGNTLSLYERRKNSFINYKMPAGVIRSLCIDHTGNMWIGTYTGLYILEKESGKLKNYPFNQDKANQLMVDAVISVFEDSRNRIWIATNSGLYLSSASRDFFKRFVPVKGDPTSFPDMTTRSIVEDFHGNIWFGTVDNGLCRLLPDGKSFRTFRHSADDPATLSSDRIFALAVDNEGKFWVGTEDGLNIFDPQTYKVVRINSDQRNRYSFTGKSIRSIFIDRDGTHWIGTYRSGVNKYDKNLAFFNLRQSNEFDPWGLSASIVTSFVERPDGDIYIGTDGGGLNVFRRATGLFDHPKIFPGSKNRIQKILGMDLVGNDLWIGTYPDGVYVWNTVSGGVKHYVKGEGPHDITGNEIFCVKKDSRGNVWIGTNGNGVSVYDPKSGTFGRFDPNDQHSGKPILPSNGFIRSIAEDRFGNIWIASHGTGIAVYDPWRETFRHLTRENSNLPYDFVREIFTGSDGTLWVGTAGEGLCRFDYKTNRFITYSESNGLANGFVHKILKDDARILWLSTNKGVSSFDPASLKFKNYSSYNGLQENAYCGGAGIKTKSGEMFFGGLDGFNYFKPGSFGSITTAPALVFTDLKISNKSVLPGDKSAISEHISLAKDIRLNYKQNFSIEFVALNYMVPQDTRYSYRLDGFDKSWNDAGISKFAGYTNLPPGNYTFRLKARSADGSWTTPETTLNIYVKPPIWLTIYAYIFYVLVAGLTLWAIRRQGIQRLKHRFKLEQERQEAERKHEFDQVRIKFLTNLSHEFRTPISLIVSPAEQLLEMEHSPEKKEQISLIKRNARRLLNLVNQLLDFRKLEESELKLNLTENDLVAFIKEVADSFKDLSHRKHIEFRFSSSVSQYHTSFDRDKIERVLFNLLSNAFKFSRERDHISLTIGKNLPEGIKIVVSDTGIGMDAPTREKIFERFYQGDTDRAILNQGNGIGLSIAREFVNMHGGTIEVESEPGKGSSFVVSLPCPLISDRQVEPVDAIVAESHPVGINAPNGVERNGMAKPVVLLIDDHEDFLNYLRSNLSSYYKILVASDGKQGWQKTLSSHPQVIVSDISMPEMDGIELCRKIRSDKRTKHIPVILLTALTGDANEVRGLDTGASDYLTKPFNFEILNLKIKNLLNLNEDLKGVYSRQFKVVNAAIEVESGDKKLMHGITQYIEANLNSLDLSVEDMSKHLCMSRGAPTRKL